MKKYAILFLLTTVCCFGCLSTEAAIKRGGSACNYSPLQNLIRKARDESQIKEAIQRNIDFNKPQDCGGSLAQLAILRGNPHVLKTLVEEGGLAINAKVSLTEFPIPGAPREVPFVFFAAYYSPRADMLNIIIANGADIYQKDDRNENILWYLSQNPILSETELYDEITQKLLWSDSNKKDEKKAVPQTAESAEAEEGVAEAPADPKSKVRRGKMIEAEPEKAFKPTDDLAGDTL